jgi:hypothetical protein
MLLIGAGVRATVAVKLNVPIGWVWVQALPER